MLCCGEADYPPVGVVDTVFMNDSRFANDEAFVSQEKLDETLRMWVGLSSGTYGLSRTEEAGRGQDMEWDGSDGTTLLTGDRV